MKRALWTVGLRRATIASIRLLDNCSTPLRRSSNVSFVAFDFETANSKRNSACALGVAIVMGSAVTETKAWRFRPLATRFTSHNVRLHGITDESLSDCASLRDIWSEILPYFENRVVLAHYACFDMSVLKHSLDSCNIRYPKLEYSCSWLLARSTWPSYRSYALPHLASRLQFAMRHHDASADATACAAIVLAAFKKWNVSNLEQLEARTRITRGRLSSQEHVPPFHSKSAATDPLYGAGHDD